MFTWWMFSDFIIYVGRIKTWQDHWSCIAHLSAEDMLKSEVIKEKKFKNLIELD